MNTRGIQVNNFSSKLIFAVAFFLPFTIFCFQFGEGGESKIEPAHVFIIILIGVAIFEGAGRSAFKRLAPSEKAVLLCLAVAGTSFVSAQVYYGWPGQLIKGFKQLIGLSFVAVFFLTVRRHVIYPETLIRAVTWIWRGCLVLALFGIWQSIAVNLLDVYFLADWEWVDDLLDHTFPYWGNKLDYFGPLLRVNSFASEPAHYCQYLLAAMGLVVFRFFPPSIIGRARWQANLPSLGMAGAYLVGYLLSFSLVGFIGLGIALISHKFILKRLNLRALTAIVMIGAAVIFTWDYLSEGLLIKKAETLSQILPEETKDTRANETGSSLILAMHLHVMLAGLHENPVLGWGPGGYPEAVGMELPNWAWGNPILEKNTEDAASMALRLLSEMGLMGFLIFTYTFGLIIWQAVRAIQGAMGDPATWEVLPVCTAITVGAISMVVVYLVRYPSYFGISFWLVLALTSVVPEVLKQVTEKAQVPKIWSR